MSKSTVKFLLKTELLLFTIAVTIYGLVWLINTTYVSDKFYSYAAYVWLCLGLYFLGVLFFGISIFLAKATAILIMYIWALCLGIIYILEEKYFFGVSCIIWWLFNFIGSIYAEYNPFGDQANEQRKREYF